MKSTLVVLGLVLAFVFGWLLGGGVRDPGSTEIPSAPHNRLENDAATTAPLVERKASADDPGRTAASRHEEEVAPPASAQSPTGTQYRGSDPAVQFAENILLLMDTPQGRLEYGGGAISIEEAMRNATLNPDGLVLDETQTSALRNLVDRQNEIVAQARFDMNRLKWKCVVGRVLSGDFITPVEGDKEVFDRTRRAAEEPFGNRPGLNVIVQGIPGAPGVSANRLVPWVRGDRYGVIEARDTAQAAKTARDEALRGFFARLSRSR